LEQPDVLFLLRLFPEIQGVDRIRELPDFLRAVQLPDIGGVFPGDILIGTEAVKILDQFPALRREPEHRVL
jgi:hypothetical protein